MAGEEDVLLDTFVRILPHPDNDKVLKDAIDKTKAMFGEVGGSGSAPLKVKIDVDDKSAKKAYDKFIADTLKAEENLRSRSREIYNSMLSDREKHNKELERQNKQRVESTAKALESERTLAENFRRQELQALKTDIRSRLGPASATEQREASRLLGVSRNKSLANPSDPLGPPPPGVSFIDQIPEGFRRAKIAARELAIEAANIFKNIKDSGNADITGRFTQSLRELQKVRRDLSNNPGDPFALEAAQGRIERLRASLISLGREGARSVLIRREFDDLVSSERRDRSNFGIETNLQSRFTKSLNLKERFELAEMISQAKIADNAFKELSKDVNVTAESLQRLQALAQKNRGLRDAISGRLDEARLRPGGFNTNNLSNNAYQLGQALEDAAVGFQLNGVSGAIRGAGNNISFLINNLSQMEAIQNRLPGAWKNLVPFIGSAGIAIGILVIPKMVEWLQKLNEVRFELIDIGEQIKKNVADAEFNVGLDIGSQALQRQFDEMKGIEDIARKINELFIKQNENIQKISTSTEALSKSGAFFRAATDIGSAIELTRRNLEEARTNLFPDVNTKDIAKLEEFLRKQGNQQAISNLSPLFNANKGLNLLVEAFQNLDIAQASVANKSATALKDIEKAAESFSKINAEIDRAKKDTAGPIFSGISEENATKLKGTITELSVELEKLNKLSKEAQRIENEGIIQGLDALIDKNQELAFGIRLAQAELKDVVFEGASKIDELFIKNEKVRTDINDAIQRALQQADPNVRMKALEAESAANETQAGLFRNELGRLLKKSQDELKKLEDRSKSSTFTDFETFTKNLQTNVLGSDENLIKSQDDLRQEISVLTEVLKNIERTGSLSPAEQLRVNREGFNVPTRQEEDASLKEAIYALIPPLFKIVESQNATTEAVKTSPARTTP